MLEMVIHSEVFGGCVDDIDALVRVVPSTDSLTATLQWLYNRRSELVGASGTQTHPYDHAYSYDSIGNRLTASDDSGIATYVANSLNQYTAVNRTIDQSVQSNNFTYDADGNLTQDDRFDYAYDDENRLLSVTPINPVFGDCAIENAYDHRNRRIKKIVKSFDGTSWNTVETHVFVWDGWNIVLEQVTFSDDTTRAIEYFWGNDLSGTEEGAGGVGGLLATRIDGVFYVPVYGANGNVMMYVSESGAISAQYDYDPYGNILQASGPLAQQFAFGFSTKYHDREVDLVAYQLRTYNPTHGRWLNRDPIEERGGLNLYAYCNGNPLYYVDVKGENPAIVLFLIAALWYPQIANAPSNLEEAMNAKSTAGAFGAIVDYSAGKAISVSVMCCGKLVGYVRFMYYERVALCAVENEMPVKRRTVAAIGAAFDPRRGNVAVAKSGEYMETPTKTMNMIAEKLGGLHQKALCENPIGACVEFKGADMLLKQGSAISDIRFTRVVRPHGGSVLVPCAHCQKMLEHFESGAIDMNWRFEMFWMPFSWMWETDWRRP